MYLGGLRAQGVRSRDDYRLLVFVQKTLAASPRTCKEVPKITHFLHTVEPGFYHASYRAAQLAPGRLSRRTANSRSSISISPERCVALKKQVSSRELSGRLPAVAARHRFCANRRCFRKQAWALHGTTAIDPRTNRRRRSFRCILPAD